MVAMEGKGISTDRERKAQGMYKNQQFIWRQCAEGEPAGEVGKKNWSQSTEDMENKAEPGLHPGCRWGC